MHTLRHSFDIFGCMHCTSTLTSYCMNNENKFTRTLAINVQISLLIPLCHKKRKMYSTEGYWCLSKKFFLIFFLILNLFDFFLTQMVENQLISKPLYLITNNELSQPFTSRKMQINFSWCKVICIEIEFQWGWYGKILMF